MRFSHIFYTIVVSGFFLIGCTDLEEDLKDEISVKIGTEKAASAATVASAYNTILGAGTANHGGYFAINEVSSDEAAIPAKGGDWFDGGIWVDMHSHEWTSTSGPINTAWTQQYGAINECNRYLKSSKSNAGKAQVKALRAYYYYRLLDSFGRVKLVTELDDEGKTIDVKQSTRKEVYDFVVKELTDVIASGNLSTDIVLDSIKSTSKLESRSIFNKAAAQALLARIYLNAEVYSGTAQWQEAIAAADEVINSGLYSLSSSYADVFSAKNTNNSEHIWVAPYDQPSGNKGMNFTVMTLHYLSQSTYDLKAQPWNGYTTLEEFYNLYTDDDDRKKNNLLWGVQSDDDGNPLLDAAVENTDPDGFKLNYTPAINELFPNAQRQGGARLVKFQPEMGANEDMSNDYTILRYADVLLIKAEATARMSSNWSHPMTLMLVNQVRDRAGVSAYTTLTADEFLAERGREMIMETVRRQDLIRFGKWGDAWWEKKAHNKAHLSLFPIPQAQIRASQTSKFKLTQNTGY